MRLKKNGTRTEEKLGELYWKSIKSAEIEVSNKFILNSVDSIIEKICLANDIDVDKIKVHVLQNSEVNAFCIARWPYDNIYWANCSKCKSRCSKRVLFAMNLHI